MLKIRLQRIGRKNDPSYRVVVVESTQGPKSGKFVELLGTYDPRKNAFAVAADRVQHWIGMGAQVSDTVHNLLVTEKIIEGKKKNVLPKKTPIVSESAETEAAPEAAPAEAAEDETPAAEEAAPAEESPATEEAAAAETTPEEAPAEEEKKEEAAA